MKLISETRGVRTYQLDDGSYLETRVELVGQTITVGAETYKDELIRARVEYMAEEQLHRRIGDREFAGYQVRLGWEEQVHEWHEDLVDEDGKPEPYFEPFSTWRYAIERAVWPKVP